MKLESLFITKIGEAFDLASQEIMLSTLVSSSNNCNSNNANLNNNNNN